MVHHHGRRLMALPLGFLAIVSCTTVLDKNPKQVEQSDGETAVLAQMGAVKLTTTYFQNLLSDLNAANKNKVLQDPKLAGNLLRDEILKYFLLDLSNQTGWSLRPEVIRKATNAANQAIVSSFLDSKATVGQSYPDETLILQTYSSNREALRQANRVRLAQIYIEGQSEARDRIQTIHHQLAERPERFAELARKYSQHEPSAASGGNLDWTAQNLLLPGLQEVVSQMKPGDISPPIQTQQGFHIIRLSERKPGEILTLEQARPLIINQLRIDEAARRQKQYLQSLLDKNPIAVNQDQLNRFLKSD
jgi:parvulin-like peptidyl-prolyl isomerase